MRAADPGAKYLSSRNLTQLWIENLPLGISLGGTGVVISREPGQSHLAAGFSNPAGAVAETKTDADTALLFYQIG